MHQFIYGIDFGTSNSTLAILDVQNNTIVKLFSTPSLLFFPDVQESKKNFEYWIGDEAITQYIACRMKGRFMKSIKKILPNKSFTDTRIAGKRFKIEDLVALILTFLKQKADNFLGQTITTAVIGRPAIFDENPEKDTLAQERLSKAAQLAGFKTYYFQIEPIGAAFTYERQINKEELVLVADFGGGTSDFSIMKLSPNAVNNSSRNEDIISKGGIYIGGDDFDADIMWHKGTPNFGRGVMEQWQPDKWIELPIYYFANICSWEKMNFLDNVKWKNSIYRSYIFSGKDYRVGNLKTLIENNLGYVLFKQIEKAKFELTNKNTTFLTFEELTIKIKEEITIADFENVIIKKNVDKIIAYLQNFLTQHNISPQAIDTVFMTGGTSHIRMLKNIFTSFFGEHKIKSGDSFNSVALGIAYSYYIFNQPTT